MSTSDTPVLDRVTDPSALRQMSDADLQTLAAELRAETIATVSRTGGHLGSSLGVVELTIALHAVFSTPEDTLIWDVGHQTYPHKILTGRRAQMAGLRQWGGLSGFTKRSESDYDPFGAAHSSTSVSAALGFAVARDLGSRRGDVVAVIGDGAMSAGMAYEALNNAGAEGRRLFVMLNDNGMSIAPPVGAMAGYLAGLSASAAPEVDRKAQAEGKTDTIFGALGFDYVGPVDGNDLSVLLPLLRAQRAQADRPVLIHCRTVKGKGYKPAEDSDDKYHGVTKFEVETGRQSKSAGGAPSYTSVFGTTLTDLAATDPKIVAITAAMPDGTGVDIMRRRFPDRVFDVGIAEQHGVTFAAGLAAAGMAPFVAIYSTFLQRAYDQVVHDVALQGLPVRFAIDRAGLVGADGATHAGAFDITYLSCLPGFTVMAAADEADLKHMVTTAAAYDAGPISFRFPRGAGVGVPLPETGQVLPIGRGRVVTEGQDVALLSFGAHLAECRAAADLLAEKGISATVADARFAKPLDLDLLGHLARHHRALFTVEEGAAGGFGAMVLQSLAETGLLDRGLAVRTLCLPDRYIDQGTPTEMYADAGLSAEAIATRVQAVLGQ